MYAEIKRGDWGADRWGGVGGLREKGGAKSKGGIAQNSRPKRGGEIKIPVAVSAREFESRQRWGKSREQGIRGCCLPEGSGRENSGEKGSAPGVAKTEWVQEEWWLRKFGTGR